VRPTEYNRTPVMTVLLSNRPDLLRDLTLENVISSIKK
jgi:hypothetical protein